MCRYGINKAKAARSPATRVVQFQGRALASEVAPAAKTPEVETPVVETLRLDFDPFPVSSESSLVVVTATVDGVDPPVPSG